MKRITLKSISIRNFKGVKSLDIQFNEKETNISGENATGKTTIQDSANWLFFGKDSTDKKDFGIIPLDSNNRPLQKVDNEVSAVLDEDGAEITLKRVHHQKWQKKRGSAESEYAGNEDLFFYNGVPQKASEYKQKIDAIMDEGVFKLITSPLYFNSLHWQKSREILTEMAGEVSLDEITARMNGKSTSLIDVLNQGKDLEEYRKEIGHKKKMIKDSMEGIPTRIDEINRNIPEKVDVKAIQKEIEVKQKAIEEIDQQIADVRKEMEAKDADYRSLHESLNKLRDQRDEIRRVREKELNQAVHSQYEASDRINHQIEELKRQIESKERQKEFETKGLEADQKAIEKLRQEWTEENGRRLAFDEDNFICPTCKREYASDDINTMKQEMTTAFMADKKKKLEQIDLKGSELKVRIQAVQKKIKELEEQITSLKTSLSEAENHDQPEAKPVDAEADLSGNLDYQDILKSIKELEEKMNNPQQGFDTSSRLEMKRTITATLDDLKKQLTINETREKAFARISELGKEENDLAQKLADLEKIEFSILEFNKARANLIEGRVNDKFTMVKFKMFNQLINGGEEETCITLIDGVPFPDANNAAKINAGLDIINALSEHYGVSAPIWIDNRESIRNLLDTDSQVINLIVTGSKELVLT